MSRKRTTMNKIMEILRLKHDCGLSVRKIAQAIGSSTTTIQKVLKAAKAERISWPPDDNDDTLGLEQRLYPKKVAKDTCASQVDYGEVHEEMRRKDMTLKLLWREHRARGYRCSYSQFCEDYRKSRKWDKLTMRQHYEPGEYVFVDFSGLTVKVGERQAQIFVAVLGASSYTFAYAVWSQTLGDWLKCLTKMLEFFGGCPKVVMMDNLKSAVTRACRYDPDYNGTFQQWADYYGICVFAARPKKPKDKALAENGVRMVQRRILAALRHHEFDSIKDLNEKLSDGLAAINDEPFSARPNSRRHDFETFEKPALGALKLLPFELTDIKTAKVSFDYHVSYLGHWYSVPFEYVHQLVEVHATDQLVTVMYQRRQIAQHPRAKLNDPGKTSALEHMPKAHEAIAKWNPTTVTQWAERTGPDCHRWVRAAIDEADHFAKVSRRCIGVLSLGTKYGKARLNLACRLANRFQLKRLKDIEALLKNGHDLDVEARQLTLNLPQQHENLRGAENFK